MSRPHVATILTDIEGTTSSLSFVRDVLFPYARARLQPYVAAHADDLFVAGILNDVRAIERNPDLSQDQIIAQLERFSDEDRKVTPLKALQGAIWADGYTTGAFRAHMYEDAVEWLNAWHRRGLRLCVYSSGSVAAQKLFFGHTEFGDLTGLFSAHFDTTTGSKGDVESYRTIASSLTCQPSTVAFLSDSIAEVAAARAAGMASLLIDRTAPSARSGGETRAATFADAEAWLLSLEGNGVP